MRQAAQTNMLTIRGWNVQLHILKEDVNAGILEKCEAATRDKH